MIHQTLTWANKAINAKFYSKNTTAKFSGVSTDTRSLKAQELFFCLKGERDGHEFAWAAIEKSAAGLVMDEQHTSLIEKLKDQVPILQVPDTLRALGDLAHAWREEFNIPILALTGSNGKTTTKELIRTVLKTKFRVLATDGNFNNLIGVPKTLFRLKDEDEIAIIEMGMNDFGEIARLTEITHPTLGLITNIGEAHLEKLDGIDGVAQAKGELFAGLSPHNTAFINLNDLRVAKLATSAKKIEYGSSASIQGKILSQEDSTARPLHLHVQVNEETTELKLKIPGTHNLDNVLAALSVGSYFKIPLQQMKLALENFEAPPARMQMLKTKTGIKVLNDCYNANPSSTLVALNTLKQLKSSKKALAILGDMNELGNFTLKSHHNIGQVTVELGIEYLVAIGRYASETLAGAKSAGLQKNHLQAFVNVEEAMQALKIPKDIDWILVKGSRTNYLEKIVELLKS